MAFCVKIFSGRIQSKCAFPIIYVLLLIFTFRVRGEYLLLVGTVCLQLLQLFSLKLNYQHQLTQNQFDQRTQRQILSCQYNTLKIQIQTKLHGL